ncbi:ribonucleoside triphosphate reductase, partial [bacterium]|nr:ribonucleoside triphosphate reductase [bacterium]
SELRKRGGGLFGSNPLTGSVGVYTINLPRIGYLSASEEEFRMRLWQAVQTGKTALEIKRKIVEQQSDNGLYPYSAHYLRHAKDRFGEYWQNHFATIGIIGMNEALLNFMGEDITSKRGQEFSLGIMEYLRTLLTGIQEETGHFYNLEASPAEGTAYRLARLDKQRYPDIITSGEDATPYYTNSTQLPVGYTDDIFEVLELQDELQASYTGGTVLHLYLGESIDDIATAKALIQKVFEHNKLPYISITPTFSICPEHGYIRGEVFQCPTCDRETEVWSRVTGYLRPVANYNKGKQQEYTDRKKFRLPELVA